MSDSAPRLTLGDLANQVLSTASAEARAPLVAQLARGTRGPEQVAAIAERFLEAGPLGRRAFLLIDALPELQDVPSAVDWKTSGLTVHDKNGAAYFPRLKLGDPLSPGNSQAPRHTTIA